MLKATLLVLICALSSPLLAKGKCKDLFRPDRVGKWGDPDVTAAILFAKQAHSGDFRKFDGLPYFTHPVRVFNNVKRFINDKELFIAALLHDVIEDTPRTYADIKFRFGKRVADLVSELSSDKAQIEAMGSKAEYLTEKMLTMSWGALIVKLADRLDNVSDFLNGSAAFVHKYGAETDYILSRLESRTDLLPVHKEMMHEIRQTMYAGGWLPGR